MKAVDELTCAYLDASADIHRERLEHGAEVATLPIPELLALVDMARGYLALVEDRHADNNWMQEMVLRAEVAEEQAERCARRLERFQAAYADALGVRP